MSKERAEAVIAGIGLKIAEARRKLGWTQQEAANRLRVEVQSYQRFERGANVTIRTLVRIANCLDIPARKLLDEPTTRERPAGRPKKRT